MVNIFKSQREGKDWYHDLVGPPLGIPRKLTEKDELLYLSDHTGLLELKDMEQIESIEGKPQGEREEIAKSCNII